MRYQDYVVIRIEGEYAILKDEDKGNEIFIALVLLPFGTDINTRLRYENYTYTVL